MTGIERLRGFARRMDELSVWPGGAKLLSIADQIEREQGERVSRMRVLGVASDMERHVSGVEGMEDSPVARWARELREALDGDAETDEDREAAAWVREHFGLDYVMHEWQSRVPRDSYEMMRQRLLGHIAECETALGRRRRRIEELGHRVNDLTTENAELRKRAMPEGCEWPRYEDGGPVRIGGEFMGKDGKTYTAKQIQFIGKCFSLFDFCDRKPQFSGFYGERVKRPAVLAADGEPLEVGQTVWDENGDELVIGAIEDGGHTVTCRYADVGDGIPVHGMWSPSDLTHQRPVLDADGVPIKKGDTVYWLEHTDAFTVVSPHETHDNAGHELKCGHTVEIAREGHEPHMYVHPESLGHTKPEPPDSYCRLYADMAGRNGNARTPNGIDFGEFLRRCKALAEKENQNE